MNVERLRKIIEYSSDNREDIEKKVMNFYSFTGINNGEDIRNILQIVRSSFRRKSYLVLEIPIADNEIGALCYRGDALGYIVINTSLPKVNVNFAICHEIYHVFYPENEYRSKVELADGYHFEHDTEYAANLFAGTLLMPEVHFRQMYTLFNMESKGNEQDTVIRLMNYFQVPYMVALIRCYELGLPETNHISENLLNVDTAFIQGRFQYLWLDDSLLKATNKDDYIHLETIVKQFGERCIQNECLNKRTLVKALQNMRTLYSEIKGE